MIEWIANNPIIAMIIWAVVGLVVAAVIATIIECLGRDRFKTVPIWVTLPVLLLLGPVLWISALGGLVSILVSLSYPYGQNK